MRNIHYISVDKKTGKVDLMGHDRSPLSYIETAQSYEGFSIGDYNELLYFLAGLLFTQKEWVVIIDNKDRSSIESKSAFMLREFLSQLSDSVRREFFNEIKANNLDERDASSWLYEHPEIKLPDIKNKIITGKKFLEDLIASK
ncbi:MAG: hypothetical protein V4665_04445 [Patescibacteria group bacterium]